MNVLIFEVSCIIKFTNGKNSWFTAFEEPLPKTRDLLFFLLETKLYFLFFLYFLYLTLCKYQEWQICYWQFYSRKKILFKEEFFSVDCIQNIVKNQTKPDSVSNKVNDVSFILVFLPWTSSVWFLLLSMSIEIWEKLLKMCYFITKDMYERV